jgi:hypothetical protein
VLTEDELGGHLASHAANLQGSFSNEENGKQLAQSPFDMTTALSRTESYALFSLSLACCGILANTLQGDGEPLIASIAFSGLAFSSCYALIRWLGAAFIRRGFKGKDLCKLKQTEMYVGQCHTIHVTMLT